MPQLCACVNLRVYRTANTNRTLSPKIVAECDTPNAGLLTYALRQIYFSLPNSSVTDFHHEIYPKTLTAAVPFGIYTQFSFHHIYPNDIYDTLCEFIIPLNITI